MSALALASDHDQVARSFINRKQGARMHRFRHWFRWAYPDDHLAWLARQTVAADALLPELSQVSITCTRGIIRLSGWVPKVLDRTRIVTDIHTALHTAGLPYRRIVNQLYVP
jgi:hypothetical protein